MSALNLNEYTPQTNLSPVATAEKQTVANKVKTRGIIALLLVIGGLIPFLGFFLLPVAFFLSRSALKLSRENLVPIEYEKPAYWASVSSTILLILTVIGLFMMMF